MPKYWIYFRIRLLEGLSHARNQEIADLVTCQCLGSPSKEFHYKILILEVSLLKVAKFSQKEIEHSNLS